MEAEKTITILIITLVAAVAALGTFMAVTQEGASGLANWRSETPSQETGTWCYIYTNCHVYRLNGGYQTATHGSLLSSCLSYDDIANTEPCSHKYDGTPCSYDKKTDRDCLYP